MAKKDTTSLYEILIRFPKAGGNEPSGAHVQYARTVVLDGEVVKDWEPGAPINGVWNPNMVLPLALVADDKDQKAVSAIMGEAATQALLEVSRLELEKAALVNRVDQLERALEEANAKQTVTVSKADAIRMARAG